VDEGDPAAGGVTPRARATSGRTILNLDEAKAIIGRLAVAVELSTSESG
jgi:hypothetical protein